MYLPLRPVNIRLFVVLVVLGHWFASTPGAVAQVYERLFDFTSGRASEIANRGSDPVAALVLGSNGSFYGTTSAGGLNGYGTVFKMTPAGTITTLVDFTGTGTSNQGSSPVAALIED